MSSQLGSLQISPPLINTSCAWSSSKLELTALLQSPHTGAVTTRTATLNGFPDTPSQHTVAHSSASLTSLNSYGYSPHPLSDYLKWIPELIAEHPENLKPFIISITASLADELHGMIQQIQTLRRQIHDHKPRRFPHHRSRVGIEINTSCPNIENKPPPAYDPASLSHILGMLASVRAADPTLTIGLKLPPYVYHEQFVQMIKVIAGAGYSPVDDVDVLSADSEDEEVGIGKRRPAVPERMNPISFLTCTNTLGGCLFFADQVQAIEGQASFTSTSSVESKEENRTAFALPTPLGGLSGEALHPLALGNVYTFTKLLRDHEEECIREIGVVGVGGVMDEEGARRMMKAGARVVGCASLLGRKGVEGFGGVVKGVL